MAATETELAYIAGLIDGEGSIDIHFNKPSKSSPNGQYFVRVTIHITNLPVLEWLRTQFGGSIYKRKESKTNWKQGYDWKLVAGNAIQLLRKIEPYMKIKKAEALVAIDFSINKPGQKLTINQWETRKDKRLELQRIKNWGRRFA